MQFTCETFPLQRKLAGHNHSFSAAKSLGFAAGDRWKIQVWKMVKSVGNTHETLYPVNKIFFNIILHFKVIENFGFVVLFLTL